MITCSACQTDCLHCKSRHQTNCFQPSKYTLIATVMCISPNSANYRRRHLTVGVPHGPGRDHIPLFAQSQRMNYHLTVTMGQYTFCSLVRLQAGTRLFWYPDYSVFQAELSHFLTRSQQSLALSLLEQHRHILWTS